MQLDTPRLVVPAYFRPDTRPDDWELLAEHGPQVRLVILNVANGPGPGPDAAYLHALDRLRQAGVAIAGYVDTNYGQRQPREALTDLEYFLKWYNVAGVCFDRVSITAEHLGYYAGLSRDARYSGARIVMFNHGAHPLEAYAEHANLLGTFEGPWRSYLQLAVPRWTRSRSVADNSSETTRLAEAICNTCAPCSTVCPEPTSPASTLSFAKSSRLRSRVS